MNYLVDTSVWSFALRRTKSIQIPVVNILSNLIDNKQVLICGAIRQELLSGIKIKQQFIKLKNTLRYFNDLTVGTNDYELAAECFNICRERGIQGSNTDFLLCALSLNRKISILTLDKDFLLFQKHLKIKLEFITL